MLTVRDTWLGPGIDAAAPYTNMSDAYPWQRQRFAEYRDTGPGAVVTVPENRPQLTDEQAESATREAYLGTGRRGRSADAAQRQAPRGPVGGATALGTPDAVTGTGWTDDGEHDDRRDDELTAGVSRRHPTPRGDPGTGR
jgi:hypothetical protein